MHPAFMFSAAQQAWTVAAGTISVQGLPNNPREPARGTAGAGCLTPFALLQKTLQCSNCSNMFQHVPTVFCASTEASMPAAWTSAAATSGQKREVNRQDSNQIRTISNR